jgi:hypothetical protein
MKPVEVGISGEERRGRAMDVNLRYIVSTYVNITI